jgi:hypothetical protein
MTQTTVGENESGSNGFESEHTYRARTPINRILERLSQQELPEKEHFESYLRQMTLLPTDDCPSPDKTFEYVIIIE